MSGYPEWIKVNQGQGGVCQHPLFHSHLADFSVDPFEVGLNFPGIERTACEQNTQGADQAKIPGYKCSNGIPRKVDNPTCNTLLKKALHLLIASDEQRSKQSFYRGLLELFQVCKAH